MRFLRILDAAYHVIRLRLKDPRLSRCMIVSMALIFMATNQLSERHFILKSQKQWMYVENLSAIVRGILR